MNKEIVEIHHAKRNYKIKLSILIQYFKAE